MIDIFIKLKYGKEVVVAAGLSRHRFKSASVVEKIVADLAMKVGT